MNGIILVRTSFGMIRRHAGRSLLTILGIMIGIAAIVITFAIGRGAEARIKEQILALGEGSLYIVPGNLIDRGQVRSNLTHPARLTLTDIYALQSQVDAIEYLSPGVDVLETLNYGIKSSKERTFGGTPVMRIIRGHEMEKGTFITDYHEQHRVNAMVLGPELAKVLFKGEDPIGKTVLLKRVPFTVVGVFKRQNEYWGTEDPNKRSYIPASVGKKYFRKPDKTDNDVDFIAIKLGKEKIPGEGLRKITRTLRQTHNIAPGAEDDFMIFDQQSIAKSAETASEILQLFGLIAASISLLVGGIGIMNIMLVSVQERTREIGIRLALGATQATIQAQFLIEAVTLCLFGGILGVIVGVVGNSFLVAFTSLPGVVEAKPLILAFLITLLVGMFFGYYPARKASRMNPVDALYHV